MLASQDLRNETTAMLHDLYAIHLYVACVDGCSEVICMRKLTSCVTVQNFSAARACSY